MSEIEKRSIASGRLSGVVVAPTALVAVLQVLAVALIVGGLAQGGAVLQDAPMGGSRAIGALLAAAAWFVAGCSAGALLWALGWLIRRQYYATVLQQRILQALEGGADLEVLRPAGVLRPAEHGNIDLDPGAASDHVELLQRLVSEVMQMNVHMLMSQAQREAKGLRRQERLAGDLLGAFESALAAHEFGNAETCIRHFEGELPDDPRLAEMESRLSESRATAEASDVEDATGQAEDMMAVASFDEAQRVADSLLSSYPSSPPALALVDRVRREGTVFLRDHRQRLYSEVQRSASARRWQQALEAAQRLIEAHPQSSEADAANAMLTTLRNNARIEQVRQLRDDFRDMMKRQRYPEALQIAQDMIERFPDTRAAGDLRRQMNRLRQLAAGEG